MSPEEIELYKDIIKIGIPAVVGLSAGLIPYMIERRKISAQRYMENEKGRRELILSFSEALSKNIGSSTSYIAYLLSSDFNCSKDMAEKISESSVKMQESEIDRTRAKALSGIIGNNLVTDALLEYDKCISKVISFIIDPKCSDKNERNSLIEKMKLSEKEFLHALGKLL
ncbi:hypothetical protein [Pseudocolwellia agarivorans]|uniref:hypothetical protein n=1 Tax=Pseudocolwellia agarivorans TaxID=1911682 RepID=UPI0009876FDA|nr:hypothetical protein [Pseudocolwellia agarivorans]